MSYGYDGVLRNRVIRAVKEGLSARAAGKRFDVGVATAIRRVRRWRETGSPLDPPLNPYIEWPSAFKKVGTGFLVKCAPV